MARRERDPELDETPAAPDQPRLTLAGMQWLAWQNKLDKGFNTTDIPLEFCLLQGEVAEAFVAWRKGQATVGKELADVMIYLLSLAAMTGVDIQVEVETKLAENAARIYRRLSNGVLVKAEEGNEDAPA